MLRNDKIRGASPVPMLTLSAGLLASLACTTLGHADEEVVTTVGQKRVRAVVNSSTGKVAAAQVEEKVAPTTNEWEVTEPETEIVEETIEESNEGDTIDFDDCNENGVDDLLEIADGDADDANGNLVPDRCEFDYGDLNLDGVINGGDLFVILGWYAAPFPLYGDLNFDGVVNSADMGLLLARWGASPF
jgi:hypothetical protein